MTLRHESLLAEKLDNLPRVRARLAERDPAVLSQLELLALQYHLQLAVDGDEGAVRAVVPQHELVLAPLDSAMLSRGLVIDDHELASLIAPKHERFAAAPPHDVLAPMHQAQPRLRRAQQRDGLGNVGDIGVLLPQQLEELDFFRLALYRHGVQAACCTADDRGEQRHGIVRREDLALYCLLVQAVRKIDRVAENVVFALDHRPRLKADAQPELAPAYGRKRDRKSTRLNSSHLVISYAVFCLKKKKPSNEAARGLLLHRGASCRGRTPRAPVPLLVEPALQPPGYPPCERYHLPASRGERDHPA